MACKNNLFNENHLSMPMNQLRLNQRQSCRILLPSMNLIFFLNILADFAATQFSSHGLFICYKAINFHQR